MSQQTSPFRIAVIVVCVERLVGPAKPDDLRPLLQSLTGVTDAEAERACLVGAELLRASGPEVLRVSDERIADMVRFMDARSAGGASCWVESVARRAGSASGTMLGDFVGWMRRCCGASATPPASAVPAATTRPMADGGQPRREPCPEEADGGVRDAAPAAVASPDLDLGDPLELTFDDDRELASGGSGCPDVPEDDLLVPDGAVDDLLSDDSVDLDADLGLDGAIDLDDDLSGGAAKGR